MMDPFSLPRLFPIANPPDPKSNHALFLDLDGTLLEIAPTPDAVIVPPDLVSDLLAASALLGGALAIVSGRPLHELHHLLRPFDGACAGEHGAIIRLPDGSFDECTARVPDKWSDILKLAIAKRAGVLLERKNHCLTVHFRLAPRHGQAVIGLCNALVETDPEGFEILQGKLAVEIRPKGISKARAVERLMQTEPFHRRIPIFVGDDITDLDGFSAAHAHGGEGLDVATRFAFSTKEVRRWLKSYATGQFR